jgi:hypothetical protein
MRIPPQAPTRRFVWRKALSALAGLILVAGCAPNGDFGEVRPSLVRDGIHDWIGPSALAGQPTAPSSFQLTDDERALRDLAFPLIQQPYDRHRWYSVAGEYGVITSDQRRTAYANHLLSERYRSPSARYEQLTDDIRNDITRLPQFFETAGRVIDVDEKRRRSLAYVSSLGRSERDNALSRIQENALIVSKMRTQLTQRASSYRFALERLVITTPSPLAVEAERALNQLQAQIARYRSLPPTWQREPSLAAQND